MAEKKLHAFPQFITKIDGVDIYFIHVKSRHPNAMPLIITHGWPGSVFEPITLIGPLTDPTMHGDRAEDAFDVVIPSLPGYGFSGQASDLGWGAGVVQTMGRQAPTDLLGIHTNFPETQDTSVPVATPSKRYSPRFVPSHRWPSGVRAMLPCARRRRSMRPGCRSLQQHPGEPPR